MYGYKGALLKAFLQMLLSPTGQAAVSQFEFTRLPPSLLAVAQAGVNAIQVIGDQTPGPWIFETLTGPNSYADNSTNTTSAGRLGNSGWVGTGLGQAASTISANRLSWATYQRNYNSLNVSLLQVRGRDSCGWRVPAAPARASSTHGVTTVADLTGWSPSLRSRSQGQVELLTNQLDASQSQVQLLQGTVTALNASLAALSRQARCTLQSAVFAGVRLRFPRETVRRCCALLLCSAVVLCCRPNSLGAISLTRERPCAGCCPGACAAAPGAHRR